MKKLARRYLELVDEIDEIDTHLEPPVKTTAPALVAQLGIGVQSAAQLLVTGGDNPERLRTEGPFARTHGDPTEPTMASLTERPGKTGTSYRGQIKLSYPVQRPDPPDPRVVADAHRRRR